MFRVGTRLHFLFNERRSSSGYYEFKFVLSVSCRSSRLTLLSIPRVGTLPTSQFSTGRALRRRRIYVKGYPFSWLAKKLFSLYLLTTWINLILANAGTKEKTPATATFPNCFFYEENEGTLFPVISLLASSFPFCGSGDRSFKSFSLMRRRHGIQADGGVWDFSCSRAGKRDWSYRLRQGRCY